VKRVESISWRIHYPTKVAIVSPPPSVDNTQREQPPGIFSLLADMLIPPDLSKLNNLNIRESDSHYTACLPAHQSSCRGPTGEFTPSSEANAGGATLDCTHGVVCVCVWRAPFSRLAFVQPTREAIRRGESPPTSQNATRTVSRWLAAASSNSARAIRTWAWRLPRQTPGRCPRSTRGDLATAGVG
jgi:hypothetical protein